MSQSPIPRRQFLIATGVAGAAALAGCTGGDSGNGDDGTSGTDGSDGGESGGGSGNGGAGSSEDRTYLDDEPDYEGWLDDAQNYEGTVDVTDQDEVTVLVGYESLAFDPAAIAISPGTEVTWEWTGQGGDHDVASQDGGPLESERTREEGHTYSHTFEESGTHIYSCNPHESAGMKGAVYVE